MSDSLFRAMEFDVRDSLGEDGLATLVFGAEFQREATGGLILGFDAAPAGHAVAGKAHPREAAAQRHHGAAIAYPVGHHLVDESHGQHAVGEPPRQARRSGEGLVQMDRIVVARRLGVAADLLHAHRLVQRRQALSYLDLLEAGRPSGHHCGLRMTKSAVASQTSWPWASVDERSKSTNSIEARALISAIRPVVRSWSPGLTGR